MLNNNRLKFDLSSVEVMVSATFSDPGASLLEGPRYRRHKDMRNL